MKYLVLTQAHLADATIVEYDPRGIKVLRLPGGDYLKVFRLRHQYGWARLHGYAQRFCKHARKLDQKGIPTVQVKQCYKADNPELLKAPDFPCPTESTLTKHTYVVEYAPLAGQTLKDLLKQQLMSDTLVVQLGKFIADLHAKGIYFRSLHLGNIVLTPDGQLGLIDIADMDIYPWKLWFSTRLRSFRHLTRYATLNQSFGISRWSLLQESYISEAKLSTLKSHWLRKKMQDFLLHPPH